MRNPKQELKKQLGIVRNSLVRDCEPSQIEDAVYRLIESQDNLTQIDKSLLESVIIKYELI
jgi:hypothetical protein